MHKVLITLAVALVAASLVAGTPAAAQAASTDPIAVAVQHAVSVDSLDRSGGPLVLDVRHPGLRGDPHDESMRSRLAAMADILGARPGSLHERMVCPERAPSPEEYLMMPCRFTEPVTAVIQVSEPQVHESGVRVNVVRWTYTEGPTPRTTFVAGFSQEVLLAPDADGGWQVVGVGVVSHARM